MASRAAAWLGASVRFTKLGRAKARARAAGAFALAAALAFICSGCWDAIDIDSRQFFSVVGLDPPSGGDPDGVALSMLASIPTLGQPSPGSSVGGGEPRPPRVLMEEGRFIEEATAILRGRMEGVMDLSTMAYIAVGPGLSPEATMGALTTGAFTQFGPLTPRVFATENQAFELLSAPLKGDKTLHDFINSIRAQSRLGAGYAHHMPELWKALVTLINRSGDMLLPIINLTPEKDGIEVAGAAVYDGAKRVGKLNSEESMLAFFVSERVTQGGTMIFDFEGRQLMVRISSVRTKVRAKRGAQGMPEFTADMVVRGSLLDSGDYRVPLVERGLITRVQTALEEEMVRKLEALLAKLRGLNSDAFRLYQAVRTAMPDLSREEFKEMYPSVKMEFKVKVGLVRAGILR